MIDTLSAEELDQLEAILGKPLDEKTELRMITASRITASSTSLVFLTNLDPLASWPFTQSWNRQEKLSWMLSLAAL